MRTADGAATGIEGCEGHLEGTDACDAWTEVTGMKFQRLQSPPDATNRVSGVTKGNFSLKASRAKPYCKFGTSSHDAPTIRIKAVAY